MPQVKGVSSEQGVSPWCVQTLVLYCIVWETTISSNRNVIKAEEMQRRSGEGRRCRRHAAPAHGRSGPRQGSAQGTAEARGATLPTSGHIDVRCSTVTHISVTKPSPQHAALTAKAAALGQAPGIAAQARRVHAPTEQAARHRAGTSAHACCRTGCCELARGCNDCGNGDGARGGTRWQVGPGQWRWLG